MWDNSISASGVQRTAAVAGQVPCGPAPRKRERACQNCGWFRKDHRKGKCPTLVKDTKYEPWP